MNTRRLLWVIPLAIALLSCAKDEEEDPIVVPKADLTITVEHEVNGEPLEFKNLAEKKYANKAGNVWEVRRLEYYLTNFKFKNKSGQWIRVSSMPELINAEKTGNSFVLSGVPIDDYTGISFMVGIMDEQNITGFLPNTIEHRNMDWPENLNGGYHHLKFEGNYLDLDDEIVGFTVHNGNIGNQSVNTIENVSIPIESTGNNIILTMDPNQWFQDPYTYDFNIDGNYTMAVDSLMVLISANGENVMTLTVPL